LIFKTPEDLKLYLGSINENGKNLFHLIAMYNNVQVLGEFTKLFTASEIVEMFSSLDENNQNVFHAAFAFNSKFFIKTIFKLFRRISPEQLKEALKTSQLTGRNLFHFTASNKDHQIASFLFKFASKILGKASAVAMLKEVEWKNSNNILHILARYPLADHQNFDQVVSLVNTHLNDDERSQLHEAKTKDGDTVKLMREKECLKIQQKLASSDSSSGRFLVTYS
jgi:hypothetical protein